MGNSNRWLQRYMLVVRDLVALRRRYPASPALWSMGARWSADELEQVERKGWLRLPREYRDWLMLVGDGGAGFLCEVGSEDHDNPGQMLSLRGMSAETLAAAAAPMIVGENGWFVAPQPAPLMERFANLRYTLDESRRHDGFLPLGTAADGSFVLMELSGPVPGRVWIDATGFEGAFLPTNQTFLELQEAWLLAVLSGTDWWLHEYVTTAFSAHLNASSAGSSRTTRG